MEQQGGAGMHAGVKLALHTTVSVEGGEQRSGTFTLSGFRQNPQGLQWQGGRKKVIVLLFSPQD